MPTLKSLLSPLTALAIGYTLKNSYSLLPSTITVPLNRLNQLSAYFSTMPTPDLTLYTWGTPNGQKISVALEEMKLEKLVGDYKVVPVPIGKNVQKEDWYIKINPNGRIPAIKDHSRNDFIVFETGAILLYLAHHYDPEGIFHFPKDEDQESVMEQWIFFLHGGLAANFGQFGHFMGKGEGQEYAVQRFRDEVMRLLGVYEIRLKDRDWLAGTGKGKYSFADINTYTWLKNYGRIPNFDITKDFPHVYAWSERIAARPGVIEGLTIPKPQS